MLNKKICENCFVRYWEPDIKIRYTRTSYDIFDTKSLAERLADYLRSFNKEWDEQSLCQCVIERYSISIQRAVPPEKCPYILEQLYNEG